MKENLNTAIKLAGKIADNWLPLKIQYDHTPGLVVCVAVKGKPVYLEAFGVSDIIKVVPMKKDALFRVASMSKMFTAVAIMQLQESGKLKIDDKVSDYLSWFKGSVGKSDLSNVTIRHLLSHNAGLFRDGIAKQWINDKFPKSIKNTISPKSVIFENATTFKYSNHGYGVLGAIVEEVSGHSFVEYQYKNIIKPLNLNNTFPDLPEDVLKKLVDGYQRRVPGVSVREKELNINTYAYSPATGFVSDAKDLAVFLASLGLDSKKSVLSRESKKEMMRVHCLTEDNEMYGLGLVLSPNKVSGKKTYGHSGGFAGYTTNAISEPEEDVQIIVLTNTISNTAWNVSNGVADLVYKLLDMKDVKYTTDEPYSGVYRSRWGDTTIVSLGNDLVNFSASALNPVGAWTRLTKKKKNTFENMQKKGFGYPGENLRFQKIKNGKAQELVSDGMFLERVQ